MANAVNKTPAYGYFSHPKLDEPYIFLKGITQEQFDDVLSYQASPNDVFVVTYPKCGTMWMCNCLHLMRSGGIPLGRDKALCGDIPFLEADTRSQAELPQEGMKILKTHLYFDLTPWNAEAKYIFIARNPKDCFTSFFYHTIGFLGYDYTDGKFDDYFELVINGAVDSGDYFKCVGEWYEKSKSMPNIIFLLYEDIRTDPRRELLKIADFLGKEWGEKMRANNNALLENVVDGSSFKKMSQMDNIFPNGEAYKRSAQIPFVRKGIIGDWKTIFNKGQSERVDAKLKEAGEKYPGFDRLWEKYSEQLSFS